MPIFKVKSKEVLEKDTKFVGVNVPQQISSFLALYALATGVTKTTIIDDVLLEWMTSKLKEITTTELVNSLGEKGALLWNQKKAKGSRESFTGFCSSLRWELIHKGLSPGVADRIINKIKDGKN